MLISRARFTPVAQWLSEFMYFPLRRLTTNRGFTASCLSLFFLSSQQAQAALFPNPGQAVTYTSADNSINGGTAPPLFISNQPSPTTMNINGTELFVENFMITGSSVINIINSTLNINMLDTAAKINFRNNQITNGSIIFLTNSSMVNIGTNAVFENNSTSRPSSISSVLYNVSSTATIGNNARFSGNQTNNSGSAIYSRAPIGPALVNIGSGAQFRDNRAGVYGGAIYNSESTIALNIDNGSTTVFAGNEDSWGANSISFGFDADAILNVQTGTSGNSVGGLLDMRDPMRNIANSDRILINKNDSGVWALGGMSNLRAATQFSVNSGTLYLYAQDEALRTPVSAVQAGILNLDNASGRANFTLASGASLVAGGANRINLGTGNIIIGANATLRGGSSSQSLGGISPRAEQGGSTSLTLDSTNSTQLQGLVNIQALGSNDVFTLNANLVDAANAVGEVVSSGLGQVVLTGVNTYTGSTTLNASRLSLGANGSISSSEEVRLDAGSVLDSALNPNTSINNLNGSSGAQLNVGNSRLQVNTNQDLTYAGRITGGGVLAKAGNSTLTFTDEGMEFTGELAIDAGRLNLDIQQDVEYNGAISGVGTLGKEGASGLSLMGDGSAFTGDILVNQGALAINGLFSQATAVVAAGTTLKGVGSLSNTTVNGTIAPGNSIGTLTISGNYVQNPGSTYEVEINAAGASDLIDVTGTATINGGTVSVIREQGSYTSQRYTILSAAGGRTGTYDALIQMMPFFDIGLTYDANNVYLDMTRSVNNFATAASTANQTATANAVESLGVGNVVYDSVMNAASIAQAQQAFNTLSGELYSSLLSTFTEDSRYARQAVLQRLESTTSEERVKRFGHRYLWAQGYGSWGDFESSGDTAAVSKKVQGLFIGADASIHGNVLGVLAGYGNSRLNSQARLSSAKSDDYTLGLYSRHDWAWVRAKMGAAYTWHQFEVNRQAQLPTFNERLQGGSTGGTTQLFGQIDYAESLTAFNLVPFVGATYVTSGTGRWQENGVSGLTGRNHFDTFYTHLGVQQTKPLTQTKDKLISERVMLAWRHAYTGVNPLSSFAFTAGGNPFAIQGAAIAKDALVIDAGLDADLPQKGLNLRLAYIGQVAQQVRDHGLTGKVGWKFD